MTLFKNFEHKNEKGTSTVEFALILPLLLLILLGIIQFGTAYNAYLTITHASREGVRLAAVGRYSPDEVIARAPSLDAGKVDVAASPSGGVAPYGEPVSVTVSYPVEINIPFIPGSPFRFNLSSNATMRSEVSGF